MIPIQHERMAFKYAISFLKNEINDIENTLANGHLLDSSERLLRQRLKELKSDLKTIEQYELHD